MADKSHFLGLYLAHEESLCAFVGALVRNQSEFDDVFQTVVLTLWEKIDLYDASRPFGPWARTVAAREVFQVRRESGRRPTPFSPEAVQAILDSFERRLSSTPAESRQLEALEHCVEALPRRGRRLVELRYSEGLSLAEMAGRIGSTFGATQRALSRVRQRLASCVKQRLLSLVGGTQ